MRPVEIKSTYMTWRERTWNSERALGSLQHNRERTNKLGLEQKFVTQKVIQPDEIVFVSTDSMLFSKTESS